MKKKIVIGVLLILILFIIVFKMNYKVEINGLSSIINNSTFAFKVDGKNVSSIPEGNYYLTSYTCKNNSEVSYDRETGKVSIKNITGTTDSCSLELYSKPLLNQMKVGDYVAYVGNNGCNNGVEGTTGNGNAEAGNSCMGENANQSLDNSNYTYGYCYNDSSKFYTYGWRIAYIENESVYLISAGAPECMTRTSSIGNATFINEANTRALDYCNSTYAYGGVCNSSSGWAMGNEDFKKITYEISGTSSNLTSGYGSVHCNQVYSEKRCGYNFDLIDNGGIYSFAAYETSVSTNNVLWHPNYRIVVGNNGTDTYGLRPIIRLSSSIFVTGGEGTMDDPYQIGYNIFSINNNSTHTNSRDVTLSLYGDGVSTMCISNSEECTYYEPYTTTKDWTLTSGDGEKTVYVYFKDSSGNIIFSSSQKIILDTVAPTNNSISISDGSGTNRTITALSTGADYMCFSNTSSDPEKCTEWVDYNITYNWMLSNGSGKKTVYAFFKDKAGNISNAVSAITNVTTNILINEDFNDTAFDSKLTFSPIDDKTPEWTVIDSKLKSVGNSSSSLITFVPETRSTLTLDYGLELGSGSTDTGMMIQIINLTTEKIVFQDNLVGQTGNISKTATINLSKGSTYIIYLIAGSSNITNDIGWIDNLVVEENLSLLVNEDFNDATLDSKLTFSPYMEDYPEWTINNSRYENVGGTSTSIISFTLDVDAVLTFDYGIESGSGTKDTGMQFIIYDTVAEEQIAIGEIMAQIGNVSKNVEVNLTGGTTYWIVVLAGRDPSNTSIDIAYIDNIKVG